ncbi:nucleotide exchange factor GrpE [Microbulbifer thermotolerans]|uniref:Protein GrpE n=1 Tax=Microbulbifer thermotolerans TaxID=252514 RepID=A0AB35I1H2_MICTH|nr:nucleotide exchange factor GrpE [Microbulbifer thermotolerans]MCX2793437.1 nucleotide exchange factor GrpE [Microbulbifer thermotolerans]MCX2802912.1 nucleotide exchange factor GrpE [Microbulbifer thermotolerans]MCX2830525.1 nucleotide exchange factor GrpE [Microbulbifer thermotolerans]MCX2834922.1 nucleotide exchange factor GrpE [Microbulbifer thermotolerans]MCX2840621.1 nucleotide exchange factor GrpE [Microbulbifer thermotolerans]
MAKQRSEEDQIVEPSAQGEELSAQGEQPSQQGRDGEREAQADGGAAEVEIETPTEETRHQADESLHAEAESPEVLREEIVKLQEQLALQKDQVLRAQAEAQNTRRRAQQDVEKAHKYAVERLLQDLLPVVDNLERALASIDADDEVNRAIVEGIELTHKSFVDTLAKHSVEVVDPAGEPFDPELHQAMTQVPNGDVEPNTVLEVFQKGYRLNGRLVRPAMVVVSKAP